MKTRMIVLAAVVGLSGSTLLAGSSINGKYVEARTAEVFTGGCIMSSEADTVGKQAVLAWKVDRGSFNGISLDGLSVVAALAGDVNLGIHEIGGQRAHVRSAVVVDERANAAQRIALVAMATELSKGNVGTVVNVTSAPIQRSRRQRRDQPDRPERQQAPGSRSDLWVDAVVQPARLGHRSDHEPDRRALVHGQQPGDQVERAEQTLVLHRILRLLKRLKVRTTRT
jgi:hypothetical protein